MKKIKKFIILFLVCTVAFQVFTGCADSKDISESQSGTASKDIADVWGTYSTELVAQNVNEEGIYAKLPASITLDVMKNETEGAQLIITAKEDISEYDLKISDLSDGKGNTISKENIEVYHEKYIKIHKDSSYPLFATGDMLPDMLLPMDIAVKYDENKVKKGENQGILIEVETTSGTKAGVYTGNFSLILDDQVKSIPVSVRVWDVEYEGRRTFQSSFLMYRDELMMGEYDSTDEMVDNYIELALKYKINTWVVESDDSTETVVERAKKYCNNDNFNSICLPEYMSEYSCYDSSGAYTEKAKKIINYIKAFAEISTEENMYLEYLYFYPTATDEADGHIDRMELAKRIMAPGGDIEQTLEGAVTALEQDGYFNDKSTDWTNRVKTAIRNIPVIFVNMSFVEDVVGKLHCTFCPYVHIPNDTVYLEKYQEAANKFSSDFWAYVTNGPYSPYANFAIDDNLLGSRVLGWIEKSNNINGFLYWCYDTYSCHYKDPYDPNSYINVYSDTGRFSESTNGDGFMAYPGKYYNSDKPFPSLRMVTYRDGQDDYDLLSVYENLLQEKAKKYGIVNFDFNSHMEEIYDELLWHTQYYDNDETVYAMRREILKKIEELKNADEFLLVKVYDKGTTKATIYTLSQHLKVNGKSITGQRNGDFYKYEFMPESGNVAIETDNSKYNYTFKNQSCITNLTQNGMQGVSCSESSDVRADNDGLICNIKTVYKNTQGVIDGATSRFKPYLQFNVSKKTNYGRLCFEIENLADSELDLYVEADVNGVAYPIGSLYCKAKSKKDINMAISRTAGIDVSKVTCIRLYAYNVEMKDGKSVLAGDKNFRISEIYVR